MNETVESDFLLFQKISSRGGLDGLDQHAAALLQITIFWEISYNQYIIS